MTNDLKILTIAHATGCSHQIDIGPVSNHKQGKLRRSFVQARNGIVERGHVKQEFYREIIRDNSIESYVG
jgi:hypothetical protein